ncbi:MAG: type I-C CRISPR-associated protein Cas8c/Csd1 [Clostridiales Family XIII bacterium]|jgi:CRISPR-associated protein Csd1|nr:type I-C CRISPR-associated protein Cas8c/Csd1 [Clostridiales Family XIII bacterium]
MILHALKEQYEALEARNGVPEPGWGSEKVSFALELKSDGSLINVLSLMKEPEKGKKEYPHTMYVPERVTRTSGIDPNFLCDNAAYILGLDTKGNPQRALKCFEACRKMHFDILSDAESEAAHAVINYFNGWKPQDAETHPELQQYLEQFTTANLILWFKGRYVHEDAIIQAAWHKYKLKEDADAEEMRCLVTGEVAPVARLHSKINGVVGAQSSGASLVSFNERAYESYGREEEQGLNAPVSRYAMFAYTTALNLMLDDYKHRQQIGDMTVVYWGEKANPDMQNTFRVHFSPQSADADQKIRGIMRKLASGQHIDGVALKDKFYVLGLAPNAARLSVRLFWQGEFGTMLNNLNKHYEDIEIVKAPYAHEYLSVQDLIDETVNTKGKNKKAISKTAGELLHSVLNGVPYPDTMYHEVLRRLKAEHKITRGAVAVIKAYLIRKNVLSKGECLSVSLDKDNRNKAYLLGRLFASLESIQRATNPNINTTIKDRYFNAACTTPQTVFVSLMKLSNSHIKKLLHGEDTKGFAITLEKERGEIIDLLNVNETGFFPARLSLKEQGMFIGGYYHQTQEKFRKVDSKNEQADSDDAENIELDGGNKNDSDQ